MKRKEMTAVKKTAVKRPKAELKSKSKTVTKKKTVKKTVVAAGKPALRPKPPKVKAGPAKAIPAAAKLKKAVSPAKPASKTTPKTAVKPATKKKAAEKTAPVRSRLKTAAAAVKPKKKVVLPEVKTRTEKKSPKAAASVKKVTVPATKKNIKKVAPPKKAAPPPKAAIVQIKKKDQIEKKEEKTVQKKKSLLPAAKEKAIKASPPKAVAPKGVSVKAVPAAPGRPKKATTRGEKPVIKEKALPRAKTVLKKAEPPAVPTPEATVTTQLKTPARPAPKPVPEKSVGKAASGLMPKKGEEKAARSPLRSEAPAREIGRKAYASPVRKASGNEKRVTLLAGKARGSRPLVSVDSALLDAGLSREKTKKIEPASGKAPMKTQVKKPVTGPPLPADEVMNELLSVAEIEAREGFSVKRSLKIFLPRDDDTAEAGQGHTKEPAGLPSAYGENALLLIVVDPNLVFIDWEIIPGALPGGDIPLVLRIYDVTGIEFDGTNAHNFVDAGLESSSGSGYCDLHMHGREILGEIGFIDDKGRFVAIVRSVRVTVPPLLKNDELGIVRKLQEAGLPVGY